MKDITVMFTAAGGLGFPSLVKSLRHVRGRKIRIIGVASENDVPGFNFVDMAYVVPHASRKSFIPDLLKICRKEKVDVLISPAPWEIVKLARNMKKFAEVGTVVSISPVKGLKLSMDKHLLLKHCLGIQVPVPAFHEVINWKDFKRAVHALGYPDKDVCFKPSDSAGSRGFMVLSAKKNRLDLLLKHEGGSVYTTLEEVLPILKTAAKFPGLLVMEFLPKEEYSVDALADNGRALVVIPRVRRKIAMGASIAGETVRHDKIIMYSEKLIASLRLNGVVGLQFLIDSKGNAKLIEINPRPHGALPFSSASGVNLLYLAIKLALNEEIKVPGVRWGTKVYRYFSETRILPE
jgi:carbamoyl-phosphate synthase large subunit